MARSPRAKRTEAADGTVSVTGKASNGEGSIYFVASKGTYRAAWVDPAAGKRRTVSAATKAQAAQRMAEAGPEPKALPQPARSAPTPPSRRWPAGGSPMSPPARSDPPPTTPTARTWSGSPPTPSAPPRRAIDLEATRAFVSAGSGPTGAPVGTIRQHRRARLRQIADCAVDLGYIAANPVGRVKLPRQTAEGRAAAAHSGTGRGDPPARYPRRQPTRRRRRGPPRHQWAPGLRGARAHVGRTSTSTPPRPRSSERARTAAAGSGNASTSPGPPRAPGAVHLHPRPPCPGAAANPGPPSRPAGSPPGPAADRHLQESTRRSGVHREGDPPSSISQKLYDALSRTPAAGRPRIDTRPGSGRTPAGAPR